MATNTALISERVDGIVKDERADVNIYLPFFLSGILSVLTAGCLLGAVALLGIARQGSYVAASWTPYVLAHANSQLYGWVGFFVMGFALQHHAPRVSRLALFRSLAYASLGLSAVGIGLRFAAEPLAAANPGVWVPVGVFSAVLQFLAVLLFMVNTSVTRYPTGPLTWQTKFVFASLGWWLLVAGVEPFFFALSHRADAMASIQFVAEWFAPYRDAQFLGFVGMMIFGVALVRLNTCFGIREAHRGLGNVGFVLWNVGLIARILGWVSSFDAGMVPGSQRLYFLGGLSIAAGAVALVSASRLFEPAAEPARSHKFLRAAFGWLLITGLMMTMEPVHLAAIGAPFSHAYTGALRHALTVGFISQMIIGVSMHVVPRLSGAGERGQATLWSVFWLLNLGNTCRVACQVLTDYTPQAFGPMGVTGVIELLALVVWAANVAVPMIRTLRTVRVC